MTATKIRPSHVLWQPHQISAATSQAFAAGSTDNPFPRTVMLPWCLSTREFETDSLPFLNELEEWFEVGRNVLEWENEKLDRAKFGKVRW